MMAEAADWRPGQPVRDDTSLCQIGDALAFGQTDDAFAEIAQQLHSRNCATVADWRTWHKGEFASMIKASGVKLKKHRNAYLVGFEVATGHKLAVDTDVKSENRSSNVKQPSGGDMYARCAKLAPSELFNSTKWLPDIRVYEGVPRKADADYIDEEAEKLYLDKLWLCAIVR